MNRIVKCAEIKVLSRTYCNNPLRDADKILNFIQIYFDNCIWNGKQLHWQLVLIEFCWIQNWGYYFLHTLNFIKIYRFGSKWFNALYRHLEFDDFLSECDLLRNFRYLCEIIIIVESLLARHLGSRINYYSQIFRFNLFQANHVVDLQITCLLWNCEFGLTQWIIPLVDVSHVHINRRAVSQISSKKSYLIYLLEFFNNIISASQLEKHYWIIESEVAPGVIADLDNIFIVVYIVRCISIIWIIESNQFVIYNNDI